MRTIEINTESFEIAGGFAISRGSRTHAQVLTVKITQGRHTGWGECVPYARYNESLKSVTGQIEALRADLERGLGRKDLQGVMASGAARNAVDCALWDLEAKTNGKPAFQAAGLTAMHAVTTAFTLSVGAPEDMAEAARKAAERPLLKVKLGGQGDDERIAAVRESAPDSTLIVDANEAWDDSCFHANMAACLKAGVDLIEQPLPAGKDAALAEMERPVVVCADESLHTSSDLESLRDRYDAVNIKLDKAGGLTEVLAMQQQARALGYKVMIGCMVGTSLAMAPAALIAQDADFVDLDGPLLLAKDRQPGLKFVGSVLYPPDAALWG
ncbi:L-alanine-DL-glutamate epimerase-like enolase superfamily enzyme [Roseibium hamelinense]|uniref:Dipeptide epimerase n=1 Tax=Roseibium hamelinense TaxID=150831 RepID=A0A562T9J0_9HYPH|nr:N-acetyl-D-Glu racemase DgcA [Roseibium hamelinense]MTI45297.1 dipeptide epimerase [Roseibium hamelinense]TWI90337.1 L-alanine-DL-glutamate epimerase-like enolase superfamily enzyme [Roseibium hamelinense]